MSRRYANARLHPRRSLTWFTQITLIPPGALSYFTENRHPTFLHWRSAVTLSRRFVAGSELLERRISVAISRVRSKFQKFAIPLASGGIAVSCVNFSAPPATRDRLARFSRNNASSVRHRAFFAPRFHSAISFQFYRESVSPESGNDSGNSLSLEYRGLRDEQVFLLAGATLR